MTDNFYMMTTTKKNLFLFLFSICLSVNHVFSQSGSFETHPQTEHLPYTSVECLHYDLNSRDRSTDQLAVTYVDRLKNAVLTDSIGVLEGNGEEIFGAITDFKIDRLGNILILDKEFAIVKVYDSSRDFVTSFGKPGQGPGEFVQPTRIVLDSELNVLVRDRRRTSHFMRRGNQYIYNHSKQYAEYPFDNEFLVYNGQYFFRGIKELTSNTIKSIMKVSNENNVEDVYFGRGYTGGGETTKRMLSGYGNLEVVGDNIITDSGSLPFIESFTPTGKLNWVVQLDNFRQHTVQSDGFSFRTKGLTNGQMRIKSITKFGEKYFVLQVRVSQVLEAFFLTYLFDAESGQGYFVSATLPQIYAITNLGFYARGATEHPRIDYYQFNNR